MQLFIVAHPAPHLNLRSPSTSQAAFSTAGNKIFLHKKSCTVEHITKVQDDFFDLY